MADIPKLTPYVIEEVIGNDNFYTHYRAAATHLEGDLTFIITEFNPSFMVRRTEDGHLEPTERFVMEFETALERFTKMGESLANLNEPFIAPIQEILQLNNTVYIVRQLGGRYRTIEAGLGEKKVDFNEAYVILRPLMQSLVAAWKKGLLFQFAPKDLAVTSYGQLILDSMFAWEGDHRHSIKEIAKLFYRLIAGVEYNPGRPDNPSIEELGLPPRLNATIRDILTGEPHYGSVDDFSKQLRTVMDAEGKREIIGGRSATRVAKPEVVKKQAAVGVIAGLAAVIILLIAAPLAWVFLLSPAGEGDVEISSVVDAELTPATDPASNDPASAAPAQAAFVRLHTGYAITDPQDSTIMLNGSFHIHGGAIYQRTFHNRFVLARRTITTGAETVLAADVLPAFITSHGGYIYFSDGLAGYNIRRVRTDGSGLETVSNHTASFLHILGNSLFYTNHTNRDFLYRMDLNTLHSEPFLRLSAYETVSHGDRLYFINGSGNFRIYSVSVDGGMPVRLNDANSDNLRIAGGNIFYRDVEDNSINRITLHGSPVAMDIRLAAASFDIAGSFMAIIEDGTQRLWLGDIGQDQLMLDTPNLAAYVMMGDGMALFIDYNDSRFGGSVSTEILTVEEEEEEVLPENYE